MTADGFTGELGSSYQSAYALVLHATVDDAPDKLQQYGGAGIATFGNRPQDFSRFEELVFSLALESGDPPLPSNTELQIQLGCSTARADDGTVHHDLILLQTVDFASSWQTK